MMQATALAVAMRKEQEAAAVAAASVEAKAKAEAKVAGALLAAEAKAKAEHERLTAEAASLKEEVEEVWHETKTGPGVVDDDSAEAIQINETDRADEADAPAVPTTAVDAGQNNGEADKAHAVPTTAIDAEPNINDDGDSDGGSAEKWLQELAILEQLGFRDGQLMRALLESAKGDLRRVVTTLLGPKA